MPAKSSSAGGETTEEAARCDFSWILFVGTKMLGFTEREVGHMTLKKWNLLYEHFRTYHNFCTSQQIFKEEPVATTSSNDEWLPD